ncbi:MAG: RNA polymerase sigma factor RpoE [Elusimicrobiota bacterium]
MEDVEIVKRIKAGEKELFEKIVLNNQDFIFNVIFSYLRIQEQAKDLTQEVLIKAYENVEKFKGDSKLRSWLYRIAYNLTLNWLEREKDREIPLDEFLEQSLQDTAAAQDAAFEKSETIALLEKTLEKIEEKHRIILNLRYVEDKSYKEISDILSLPLNTVKVRILRAKKALIKAANQS